jgi:hypothetical protein
MTESVPRVYLSESVAPHCQNVVKGGERMRKICVVITVTLVASVGTGGIGTLAAAPASCRPVMLYGIRGSGEAPGLGTPISALLQQLQARYGVSEVGALSNVYPAVGINFNSIAGSIVSSGYVASTAQGIATMKTDLTYLASCTSSKIVLAGYSQGADVLRHTLLQVVNQSALVSQLRPLVARVVLFGDPYFASSDFVEPVGNFNSSKIGMLPWLQNGVQPFPTMPPTFGRPISVCHSLDPICQMPNAVNPATHKTYDADAVAVAALLPTLAAARTQTIGATRYTFTHDMSISPDGAHVSYIGSGGAVRAWDRLTGKNEVVSLNLPFPSTDFGYTTISGNGRYVTFADNTSFRVFIRDRVSKTTTWLSSVNWDPVMTPDARFVTFQGSGDVRVLNRITGATEIVSRAVSPTFRPSQGGEISDAARWVAFDASNNAGNVSRAYAFDRTSGRTYRADIAPSGSPLSGIATVCSVQAGRVAFIWSAPGSSDQHLYVRNVLAGTTTLVPSTGGLTGDITLSTDGHRIGYNYRFGIRVFDLTTAKEVVQFGVPSGDDPRISGDGHHVVFRQVSSAILGAGF